MPGAHAVRALIVVTTWERTRLDTTGEFDSKGLTGLTAVFRWVRPRPRGQTLGGDPCLSTGDTREALPARAQAHQLGRTQLKTAVSDESEMMALFKRYLREKKIFTE
jgi:hypothetical protein